MATKYPPALDVNEAITVIEKMYSKHNGNEVAVDLMPEILGVKSGSSYFPMKISALQKYGLVRKSPEEMLVMTELAMQIVNPLEEKERTTGILSLFENTDVLSDFYTKYGKTNLPSPEQVKATLNKSYGIDRVYVNRWYDYIIDSFKVLNLIGKKTSDIMMPSEKPNLYIPPQPNLFKIPLMSGKVFEFSMPEDMSNEDLDFVVSFFELRKKNVKK
jgi:hypothetical protein